jgi:hypothetical protein
LHPSKAVTATSKAGLVASTNLENSSANKLSRPEFPHHSSSSGLW